MTVRHGFWIPVLALLLVSCGKSDRPNVLPTGFTADSIIPETKMVCILTDVHIIEAALLMERNEGVVSTEKNNTLYQDLFRKYHINKKIYERNLRYYSMNPELFVKMYDKVILQIEQKQKLFTP